LTSDFRPEVEIRQFRACALKNMQRQLWLNHYTDCIVNRLHKKNFYNLGDFNSTFTYFRPSEGTSEVPYMS